MSFNTISGSTVLPPADKTQEYADYLNKAIVTPSFASNISGWVFDIPSGETIDSETDITDHYIETGSFINDHAVNKPDRITLRGFVGNLARKVPQKGTLEYTAQQIQNKLTEVSAYLGPFTEQYSGKAAAAVEAAMYAAKQAKAISDRASGVVKWFTGEDSAWNQQQRAYWQLRSLQKIKALVNVDTPWQYFPYMMITSISAVQGEDTTEITEFSITLKEVRFVDIKTVFNQNLLFNQPASDIQSATKSENGTAQGEEYASAIFKSAQSIGAVK